MPDPLDTVSAQELYDRGMELAQNDDYVRAEQYLAAAMERGHPENAVMGPLIASCVRSSRMSAALGYAEPYLERHPEAWSLRLLVATIHMGLGEPAEARNHLLQVTLDQPGEAVPHYMLAVLLRDELRDLSRADEHFRRYLEIAPEGEHASEARAALSHVVQSSTESSTDTPSAEPGSRPVQLPPHASDPAPAAPGEASQ